MVVGQAAEVPVVITQPRRVDVPQGQQSAFVDNWQSVARLAGNLMDPLHKAVVTYCPQEPSKY